MFVNNVIYSSTESMSQEMAEDADEVECGFCMRRSDVEDPRSLPCSHVHCFSCISASYEINNLVQCPLQHCRFVINQRYLFHFGGKAYKNNRQYQLIASFRKISVLLNR